MPLVQRQYSIECIRGIGFASVITVLASIKKNWQHDKIDRWKKFIRWASTKRYTCVHLSFFGPPKTGTRLNGQIKCLNWPLVCHLETVRLYYSRGVLCTGDPIWDISNYLCIFDTTLNLVHMEPLMEGFSFHIWYHTKSFTQGTLDGRLLFSYLIPH